MRSVTNDAVIYCRISKDREGRSLGVERQEELCRELAERLDLRVVRVLNQDNDISASTLSTKRRADYERMLQDIEAGKVTFVLAYSTSRLTRRTGEMDDLITLGKAGKVRIHTLTSGELDWFDLAAFGAAVILGSVGLLWALVAMNKKSAKKP